ncbi:HAD family hydrolase [Thalassotalea sp. HSM 43]|uniref:HAD family hydrolase n=1 Tax=Thalassotalea sp. HSM 43 TaxID=2552945 RepID=UPI00108155D2|nr:HAD-IA family hydrolase [Thalassotalea sp. HSM 43]QBY05749.1 HAD family hydrolase [Thalassotalea sp. HSM 43]
MLSQAKGVLFDLDGTLLDTAKDLGACLNYLMDKYGFEHVSYEQYRLVASDGVYPLLDLGFAEQLVHFDREQLRQEFLDYYLENIAVHSKPFDGIVELIDAIERQNVPWGVVTNKPAFLTDPLMLQYPEFKQSIINVSGDTLPQRKPDPAPMLLASEALGVASKDIWYFGDAERDIQAGRRADMTTVIAKWGYIKNEQELASWQANYCVAHPLHILAVEDQAKDRPNL